MITNPFDTNGIQKVGEVTSRTVREAICEPDYQNAYVAGATRAFEQVLQFAGMRIQLAGEFDDTRALRDLEVWLGDRIRDVHSIATDGTDNAQNF